MRPSVRLLCALPQPVVSHFRADLVLNDFVLTAQTQGVIKVLSDGTPWRPLIHVKDIGRAVSWACQSNLSGFQMYNVGSNNWTLSIGELAASVGKILNVPHEILNENGPDKRSYKVAFDKFETQAAGWLPRENLQSTVIEIKEQLLPYIADYSDFRLGKSDTLKCVAPNETGKPVRCRPSVIGRDIVKLDKF